MPHRVVCSLPCGVSDNKYSSLIADVCPGPVVVSCVRSHPLRRDDVNCVASMLSQVANTSPPILASLRPASKRLVVRSLVLMKPTLIIKKLTALGTDVDLSPGAMRDLSRRMRIFVHVFHGTGRSPQNAAFGYYACCARRPPSAQEPDDYLLSFFYAIIIER